MGINFYPLIPKHINGDEWRMNNILILPIHPPFIHSIHRHIVLFSSDCEQPLRDNESPVADLGGAHAPPCSGPIPNCTAVQELSNEV